MAFSDEEDHYLGFLGSYAFTGQLDMKAARRACNPEGLPLAEALAQCGLDIEPADKNLQDSQRELIGSQVNNDQGNCPVIRCY